MHELPVDTIQIHPFWTPKSQSHPVPVPIHIQSRNPRLLSRKGANLCSSLRTRLTSESTLISPIRHTHDRFINFLHSTSWPVASDQVYLAAKGISVAHLPVIFMISPAIVVKDLVLIGGGHAHVHTIKMLGMKPIPGVSVTLISKDIESPYSGMIPGFVAGHYTREECHVDLAKLCSFSAVNMIHSEVCEIDIVRKLIFCKDGRPPIHYDLVSIDVGISPKPIQKISEGSMPNITPVKPIDGFAVRWEIILARVLAAKDRAVIEVAIVGGGAGGVELCFAMHHRLQNEMKAVGKDSSQLRISIYNRGKTLMSSHSRLATATRVLMQ